MVMARGAGCWVRASGASTRTVERTERRNENFIRNDPLNGYESKGQTKKFNTRTSIDGARGEVESWSEGIGRTGIHLVRKYGQRGGKYFRCDAFFSCMQRWVLYSANANSFYRSGESEFPLRGRE